MSHDHKHSSDSGDLKLAFFLNFGFAALELVGGLLINSVAILSDALHDLGDSLSLGLAWFLQGFSQKESDQRYSYGYRRFSLLGAFINAVVLIIGSLFVLNESFQRLANPESFSASGMIVFAIFGIAANGLAAWRLRDKHSANARVVGLHLLEDVLGWIAVMVVGLISLFVDLPILDPILSILIAAWVLFNVMRRLRESGRLFLQAVPEEIDLEAIQRQLSEIEGVESIHHTHIWSLDAEHNVFTTHLVVADDTSRETVRRIRRAGLDVAASLKPEHSTIAVEYASEDCDMR